MDFETAKKILRYYICGLSIPTVILNEAIYTVVMFLDGNGMEYSGDESTLYWN